MELALHIADFTWSTGPAALGPALARHVREAEAAGIGKISLMDHFWQVRGVGQAEDEMLEAYAALGFIAAHTERARLHVLVTGVTYRDPGLLAKQVSTLDVLSGGRVGLGIGAAWNEEECQGLGFNFWPTAERFERLEETLKICLQMWSDSEEPFAGKHYHLGRTLNSPQSVSRPRPYLLIGGSGEKKTLRLAAQYADACNIFASPLAGHKLNVLRGHCDAAGRDYAEIEKTTTFSLDPGSTADDVVTTATELARLGFTTAYVFARGITDRESIIAVLAEAQSRMA